MTAAGLAARLQDAGLDARETVRKRQLIELAIAAANTAANDSPPSIWWVPGRLEVFGKHTDYCGGHSLIAAIPRGFVLIARPRADGVVRLVDAHRSEQLTIQTASPATAPPDPGHVEATGWRRYAHVIVRRLLRNFPGAAIGADLTFASDLAPASGMSSSSALVVALAHALISIGGITRRAEWRDNIAGPADLAGYYACFENGLAFGSLAGDGGVGTHGGSEDHVAIVSARPGHLSAWRFVPITHESTVALPGSWTFVVAFSGAAAQKTGSAMAHYNRLSQQARALLDIWKDAETPHASLHAALTSSPSAPDRLRRLVQARTDSAALLTRLDHFLAEDQRVLEAVSACQQAHQGRMGELADASQREAESLLGNQVVETIALARMARTLGAVAASSFGAGFGGSVWALVDRDEAETFTGRWLATYRQRFPARNAAATFVARPGPPLTRLA